MSVPGWFRTAATRTRAGLGITSDNRDRMRELVATVRSLDATVTADDYDAQPAGNSGARVACGVIAAQ